MKFEHIEISPAGAAQMLQDYDRDIVRSKQYNAMVKPLYCARALANDPYLYGGVK